MKISIVILNWNTKDLLNHCLESIAKSRLLAPSRQVLALEIIVVDNGSTDGSQEMISHQSSAINHQSSTISHQSLTIKLIKNPTNLGFAKGSNQGIKAATGDLIMLLNSDTIVQKGALEKLADFYLQKKDKNIAFSPLLLDQEGRIQEQYYLKFPNLWQIFFYHNPVLRPLAMKTFLKRFLINDLGKIEKSKPFELAPLQGAALMAPKEVWQKAGLLDEDYQFLFEDVDWSWRAQEAGVRLFLLPQAKITHFGGASWQKKDKKASLAFYTQHFNSFLLFVKKNYGETQEKKFRIALIINFIFQGKFKLAKHFI